MPYALVTGPASGIGKGIAKELARRDYDLLLVDIDYAGLRLVKEEISGIYDVRVYILQVDLSAPGALRQLQSWTSTWHDELEVVVNNAGYGLNGGFTELTLSEQLNMIDLNIKAQVSLSHAYIPVLQQRPEAWLLNVASTTAFQTVPYLNVYAASKAFVLSFSRGLRFELRNTPVSVSVLVPGSTDTNFVHRARMGEKPKNAAKKFNMDPQLVAKIAVDGMFNRKAEIIPGFTNKLHGFLPKFFPKLFAEKIAADIYRPEKSVPATTTSETYLNKHEIEFQ